MLCAGRGARLFISFAARRARVGVLAPASCVAGSSCTAVHPSCTDGKIRSLPTARIIS